jgi:pseudouridine kinase
VVFKFGGIMILVVGGANIDIFGYPLGEKLIKRDSNPGKVEFSMGGVGRNIAENLSLLGFNVSFLGAVGNDANGKRIIEESTKSGIDMSMVKIVYGEDTSVYLCILDENKDMDVAVCQMGITDYIDEEYIDYNYEKTKNAELIVLDGNLKEDQLKYILDKYKGSKFLYDPVSTTKALNAKKNIGQFYCIKPNKLEAEALSDIQILDLNDCERVCGCFHGKGVKKVFITLGEMGTFFSDGKEHGLIKPVKVKMENATGAGDSFAAGLAYGIVKGFKIERMASFAAKCAEVTISSKDTINKNISEKLILKELNNDKS